jgi:hypothetical protein
LGNIAQNRGYDFVGDDDWVLWHFATVNEILPNLIPGQSSWPFIWVEELDDWSVEPDIHSFQLHCFRDLGWYAVEEGLLCQDPQPPKPSVGEKVRYKVTLDDGEVVIIDLDPEIQGSLCILVNAGALGYRNGVCYENIDPDDWDNVISVEVVFEVSNVDDLDDCEESLPGGWIGDETEVSTGVGEWEVSYESVNADPEINVLPSGHEVGYSCGEVSETIIVE